MNLADFGLVPHACRTVKPGDVYGRLTIVAIGKPPETSYRYTALCRCSCGAETKARLDGIRRGAVVSCGCYHSEISATHRLSKSPLYHVWRHMLDRCNNPMDAAYANYGGRGIRACARWHDLSNFYADMRPTYSPGLELDRRDNDGHYEPGNCQWTTRAGNSDNRRNGRKITFQGRTQSIKRWAEELGLNYGTLYTRLVENRWTPERALTTPPLNENERMAIARAATTRGF